MRLATVVWRPMSSDARTAPVSSASRPNSAFNSVDLPAPDSPRTIATVPAGTRPRTSSSPHPEPQRSAASLRPATVLRPEAPAEVATMRMSCPSTSWMRVTSVWSIDAPARSAFVRITAMSAPQSRAITADRTTLSTEMGLGPRAWVTSTVSTFAASVCLSPREPPFHLAMSLSRGRILQRIPMSCPSGRRAQTQSPTAARELSPPLVSDAANSVR